MNEPILEIRMDIYYLGIRKKVQQFIGFVDNISSFGQLLQWNGQMLLYKVLSSMANDIAKDV